jgi:hypothetical protein
LLLSAFHTARVQNATGKLTWSTVSLHQGEAMTRIAGAISLITWLCVVSLATATDKPMVVELWPGKVPEETGNIGPEKVRMSPKFTRKEVEVTESTRLITNVSKPTITIHRPAKDKDTGAAVLICPGGDQ